jgi:amidase
MNKRFPMRPAVLLAALFPIVFLSGCAAPLRKPKAGTADRTYIEYWPPDPQSTRLRLAVKDLIDMKGVITTAGSEFLLKNSPPAKRDARCLALARQRNVQFVGKTNTTELAVAVSGINEYFGTPRNPVGRFRPVIPGGSSSGSAVAVANGSADVALGTDTAGSIRIPAACCGVVGLKTTFGLVPLDGVYPIAPNHLDTIGPIAPDVDGAVTGMGLLQAGFEAQYRRAVAEKPTGRKIRVGRLYLRGTDPRVDRAIDAALEAAEFEVVKLDEDFRKSWTQAQEDATTVAAVSAWVYDQKFRNEPGVTLRTKAVVAVGGFKYRTGYKDALARQATWKQTLRQQFQRVDLIALPTLQRFTPRLPLFGGTVAFEAAVLAWQNTAAVNFAGVPALAVPVPSRSRRAPVTSLQLVGPVRGEAALLNAGRLVEAAVGKRGGT